MNRQKCLRLAFYSSMPSGYFHFGNSHFFFPHISFLENILQVFADSRNHNPEKLWPGFLCAPNVFAFCN